MIWIVCKVPKTKAAWKIGRVLKDLLYNQFPVLAEILAGIKGWVLEKTWPKRNRELRQSRLKKSIW